MKHIKLFEELNISRNEFPENAHELNSRENKILVDLVGEEFLKKFKIRKEDNYYYTSNVEYSNQFDVFSQLKDYLLFRYLLEEQEDNKSNELLELLKSTDFDPSFDKDITIRRSSRNGYTEVVKYLLRDPRVDPSNYSNDAIWWSSKNGHTEIVDILLKDSRVDPTCDDNYPITAASQHGYTEIVKLLLQDKRVDPSVDYNYAIRISSQHGYTEIVKLLLKDPRVDPSDEGNYPILLASSNGHTEIVKLLLKDPRVRDKLSPQEFNKYFNEIS